VDLPQLVVRRAVRHNGQPPALVTQPGQSLQDLRPASHQLRHPAPIPRQQLLNRVGQCEPLTREGEEPIPRHEPVAITGDQPHRSIDRQRVLGTELGHPAPERLGPIY
jgi:hypothetical protein